MKGILFKPDMLKAIVEGRKDVTRRVMKIRPFLSPYLPGEVVYVKEGWTPVADYFIATKSVGYKDGSCKRITEGEFKDHWVVYRSDKPEIWKFRSPLIMPAWAARYWLRIKNVRAERLQEITWQDAIREGVEVSYCCNSYMCECRGMPIDDPRLDYTDLWDSIYGPGSWDKNPWVWRIEFELLKDRP
jgi:hypothetical protein